MSSVKKINLDDLEHVSGGVIVEKDPRDRSGRYTIVDDTTGESRFTTNSKDVAQRLALGSSHTSEEVISPEEYAQRFGKPFEG